MLRLKRDSTTGFVVTLNETTTISNPEYLFEFINSQSDDDNDTQYCILTDTSSSKERYNEFSIIDGTDVNFPINGDYEYNIYEQANGSGNLDPTGLTLVEHGRAYVYIDPVTDNEYSDSNEADKFYEE